MFERPIKTLKHSLFKVLENAQEYVADVCFEYPNHDKIWAHKAILMARVPEPFRLKYLNQLSSASDAKVETFNLSVVIPYTTLRQLLRFWYIAEYSAPLDDASLVSTDVSGLSQQDKSLTLQSQVETNIRNEIKALEEKIGMDLLPKTDLPGPTPDTDQWTNDLKKMLDEHLFSDVVINIFNVPHKNNNNTSNNTTTTVTTQPISAHRFILASQSPYFYSVFCTEFREASTSSVHLPSDLFSPSTLQVILYYFYTDTLILPPINNIANKMQARVNEKKHELRILQRVFTAADYLGHYNTICKAVLLKMAVICHQFKCVCNDCAILLPSMLLFADKHEKYVPKLRQTLISLYADPLDSLAPLWSQKPFAILVGSFTSQPSKHTLDPNTEAISKIFSKSSTSSTSTIPSTTTTDTASSASIEANGLIQEITERTFANMTKHNCVRALHSLHLCLSQLRGADPFPTWSQPVLSILNQFLHHTIDMIANNFDYYCVEYPILLSCVDGIGFGFSVDFLGFVLTRILTDGIHDGNAAIIYQGIVRDLGGRQEMVKNVAVDGVLFDARLKCAQYLSKRWAQVKAEGGFNTIEKEILRLISEDINVPVRSLSKPMENENFKFSFKSKKSSNTAISKAVQKEEANLSNATKRLSLGSTDDTYKTRIVRTRSLSASSSTAPESILRKDTQFHHSDTEEMISTGLMRRKNSRQYKRQDSTGSLTDALLPIDTVTVVDKKEETNAPRPTRLRFALPDTPSRVPRHQNSAQKASAKKNKKRAKSPGKSRWGLGYSTSDSSDDEAAHQVPKVGYKVELLRRPLPTQGTIKYIGPVDFSKGTWVGVELESRLGNNDGSVDGKRYFQTFPQRGVFIKIDDFKIISTGEKK